MRTVVTSTHSSLRRAVVLALLGIAILFGDPVLSPASVGAVTLVWSPSPDPVVDYNIYRSTTSGFAPTTSNKIGQTTGTTYTDSSFSTAGTYYYLVTAQGANGKVSVPSNEAVAMITLDTTSPKVALTAPTSGATVSRVVTITASASDDVGIAGVQFLLDGASLGAEVTGPRSSYTYSWTTTTVANGAHTLSARARDGAGNTALAANVPVTISNAPSTGLVAAYSFNEGSGTSVSDSSGNNLTGKIIGATWTTSGAYGSALSFDGVSSYVDLGNPAALQLTGSMTLEAWVMAAANPPDDGQIVAKSNGTGWQLKTSPDTGPQTFGVKVSGADQSGVQRYSTTARSLKTWYHVAGVYDASSRTLSTYVNGVLNNGTLMGTIPASQFNQNVNVNIGRRTGGLYFNGAIDEVRIYNRALSQAEIQTDLFTPIGGAPSTDKTPPTVSVTAPAAGTTLSGSVTVTASATDNVGMAGVQFLLDGANLGAEVTDRGPTYVVSWTTTTAKNGAHTLSARARDAAGNTSVAANAAVTVSNAALVGPIASYSFNQGSGTTAADSSGNGLTGTLVGAAWTSAGKYGNALSFNGTTSYVDLGNPARLNVTGSMTWSAWVYATATPPNDGQIISKSNETGGWQLKTSPDTGPQTFGVKVTGAAGSVQRYSNTVRALNTWYHVAGVYNPATLTLDIYVNGKLDNGVLRGTVPSSQVIPNLNVNIGRRAAGYYFAGIIDDVRVFDRALSQTEIQSIMNTPLP